MTVRAFEPGWEIGVKADEEAFIEVGTVKRIAFNGRIVVEHEGHETIFEHTGSAVDADEHGFPCLVPLTREWRQARRMEMIYSRLREINWRDWEDKMVSDVYRFLEERGVWEWCDDTEEDYTVRFR